MKKNIKYWLKAGWKRTDRLKPSELGSDGQVSDVPQENGQPQQAHPESWSDAPKDYVSYVSDMVGRIVNNVDNLLQVSTLNPSEHILEVYVGDNLLYEYCLHQGFVKLLEERLYMDRSYAFKSCRLLPKSLEQDVQVTEVLPKVSIRLQKTDVPKESASARIRALDNCGSLLEGPVLLDGSQLATQRANIGVGRHVRLDNGSIRFNVIAIDNDTESPQYEHNKYVSRSHANIQYRNGRFMLFVETGGTSRAGKRTAISRNGELIKLDVAGMGINLEDGDQIILSKHVILIFEKDS